MKKIDDDTLVLIDEAMATLQRLRERLVSEPEPDSDDDFAEENLIDELRRSATDMGIPVFQGTVSERDAARLLGRSPLTLRNRRLIDQPIPFERVGRSIRYRLEVLAEHLWTGGT